MPYSTTVLGKIVIGSGNKTIPVPVSAKLPGEKAGTFVFEYTADKPEEMTHLDVGLFADWVGKNVAQGVLDKSSLPASLQTSEVALKKLRLDAGGNNFEIQVLLGTKGSDSKWRAEWKPFANLPLTVEDLLLDIKQT